MKFKKGFEKVARGFYPSAGQRALGHLTSAGILGGVGALAGGEQDEFGNTHNRGIGAARAAGFSAGWSAAAELAHALHGKPRKLSGLASKAMGQIAAGIGGGIAGYHATKHLGPKYDHEHRLAKARERARKRSL